MSHKINYSPLLRAHTPPPPPLPQPCHKVCDVSSVEGRTLLSRAGGAVLCGSDPPDDSAPALNAHPWPDSAEESSKMDRLLRKCQIRNQLVRECMAECLGVYIMIVSGCLQ